jgi:hypothetical protein
VPQIFDNTIITGPYLRSMMSLCPRLTKFFDLKYKPLQLVGNDTKGAKGSSEFIDWKKASEAPSQTDKLVE